MKRLYFLTLTVLFLSSSIPVASHSKKGLELPNFTYEAKTIDITSEFLVKKLPLLDIKPLKPQDFFANHIAQLYNNIGLEAKGLSFETFQKAMIGYFNMYGELKSKEIISIVDFDKSSTVERLYVIDINAEKVLFHSLVAHGKNTGFDMAENFSNTPSSLQSSLGFYLTAETYIGHFGYALRLDGMEKGFNDNARARGIVMHGADYVNKQIIASQKRLGRSYGCPALPYSIHKDVITTIKGGSLFYIHKNQPTYQTGTKMLDETVARKTFETAFQTSEAVAKR